MLEVTILSSRLNSSKYGRKFLPKQDNIFLVADLINMLNRFKILDYEFTHYVDFFGVCWHWNAGKCCLEKQVQDTLLKLADEMLLKSAHDCSDGGLAIAIAECCFSSLGRESIGAAIELQSNTLSPQALLFSESPSRMIISFSQDKLEAVKAAAGDCPFTLIGTVGNDILRIMIDGSEAISSPVAELETIWETALEKQLSS